MNKPPCIVFDLDGTLVDSAPDLAAAANELLRRRGRNAVPPDRVRSMVGQGARALLEKMMAATGPPAAERDLDEMTPEYLDVYGAMIADNTVPFPGVREALSDLSARGFPMGVCTNKSERLSRVLLERLGLSHHFGAVLGGDSLPVRKPDGRHVLAVVERVGGDPARSVMVGDSGNDVDAAKEAGVASIAVTFGYTDVPPHELGADRLIDRFDRLIPTVDALFG